MVGFFGCERALSMRRVAIYSRVSTSGGRQTVENQERVLREIAERSGWEVVEIYSDAGVSGTKGRDKRPALDRMLKDATRRRFDMVMAWSVDRLGRSLQHLVTFLSELQAAGIDLFLHQQGIDTTTPAGKAMYQMMGVFAEFERSIIVERVNAGLATARAKGKTLGRPKLADKKKEAVVTALATGKSIRAVAAEFGVGVGTVHRLSATTASSPA
jgi:DNA invertase Pin-like site-specific DNA recombinase